MIRATIKIKLPERVLLPRPALAFLGAHAIGLILQRTRRGLDVDGVPFAPYSPDYTRKRQLAGMNADVRLQLTGAMLRSLRAEIISSTLVRVGLEGAGPSASLRAVRGKSGKLAVRKIKVAGQAMRAAVSWRLKRGGPLVLHAEKAAGLAGEAASLRDVPRVFVGLSAEDTKKLTGDLRLFLRRMPA